MSAGVVIPGVSSSVILMTLGVYTTYLSAVANIDLSILFPMGIGLFIGSILFLKLIQFLFSKYYAQTFYGIIGFVLGSVLVLYPRFHLWFRRFYFLSFICNWFLVKPTIRKERKRLSFLSS
mgnify:FL=1